MGSKHSWYMFVNPFQVIGGCICMRVLQNVCRKMELKCKFITPFWGMWAKIPLGMLASNIRVLVKVPLNCFCSSGLLMSLERQQRVSQMFGSLQLMWGNRTESWLLAYNYPRPDFCSRLGSESVDEGSFSFSFHHSAFQMKNKNKTKTAKTKQNKQTHTKPTHTHQKIQAYFGIKQFWNACIAF